MDMRQKTLTAKLKETLRSFQKDFRFQISKEESAEISRCQNFTAMSIMQTNGMHGGRTSLPYAFTEQGIYMLMTVLKGELATKQSLALIRLFKSMKDYIVQTNNLVTVNEALRISRQVNQNTRKISKIEKEISVVMDNFTNPSTYKHFLILDGERLEADVVFQKLYSLAMYNLIIIDDYISVKTLELLKVCSKDIQITICSDNVAKNGVSESFFKDFLNDTGMNIVIKPTNNKVHDRYIVIDYKTDKETIYHSGSSSKDSGNKITTIMSIENSGDYHRFIDDIIKSIC